MCSAASALILSSYGAFTNIILTAVEEGRSDRLGWLSLAVIALFGIKYWFTRGQTYYLSLAAARLTSGLRQRLFDKLQRLPIAYHNEKRLGATQSVLTNDVNVYQNAISIVRDSIDGPIKIVGGFITIFVLQWKLALASMVVIPVLAYVIQRNSRKMKVAQADVQNDLAAVGGAIQELLSGTRVIRAFGAEERASQQVSGLIDQSLTSQARAIRRIATLRPLVELIGAFGLAFVVYLCGSLVRDGSLTVASLGAFLIALDVINQGAKNLGSLGQTLGQIGASTDRIYAEVLDVPEEVASRSGLLRPESARGLVEFRQVGFAYPDGTRALSNVSFVIEPGQSLALVGPSGSGKSTIADLMLRFYDPSEGTIFFDGVDVRELDPEWLRAQIGVVPQQTFLFAGSIAENIRLGSPSATPAMLEAAARAAHVEPFAALMPRGLDTDLGERGVRLSGGEMQRVAIARAVVRRPTMLLLDEATSNLDAMSEKAVQEALEEVMRGRTTLFIAHRLTTAARADRILMLRRGEVLEYGSHRQLIDEGGAYAGMVRAFTSGSLSDELG